MLNDVLDTLGTITLDEMDSVRLLNRIDTKYVTTVPVLREILRMAAGHGYRVLETEGARQSPYDSRFRFVIYIKIKCRFCSSDLI